MLRFEAVYHCGMANSSEQFAVASQLLQEFGGYRSAAWGFAEVLLARHSLEQIFLSEPATFEIEYTQFTKTRMAQQN